MVDPFSSVGFVCEIVVIKSLLLLEGLKHLHFQNTGIMQELSQTRYYSGIHFFFWWWCGAVPVTTFEEYCISISHLVQKS